MDNKKLSELLTEAAEILNDNSSTITESIEVILESVSSDEGKKIASDINDAIKEKDSKKLRTAIAKFKKWFLLPDPEGGKHQKLRDALAIIYALLCGTLAGAGAGAAFIGAANLIAEGNTKFLIVLIAGLMTTIATFKSIDLVGNEADKLSEGYVDEYIKKLEKKVKEFEKSLEKYDGDKTSKEYKQIAKAYKESLQWLEWFKSRKDYLIKKENIKVAKEELKEAKKSKDAQKIAEKKAKYKAARSLVESAIELLDKEFGE